VNHECPVDSATNVELHPINALGLRREESGDRVLAFMRVQPAVREDLSHHSSVSELSWTANESMFRRIPSIYVANAATSARSAPAGRFGSMRHDHSHFTFCTAKESALINGVDGTGRFARAEQSYW
jgi:hypothetical protein